jgi:hypothetical protein
MSLWPSIIVDIGESLDPLDPFATTFAVLNNGLLTIYDVQFTCGLGEISTDALAPISDPSEVRYSYESRLSNPKAVAKLIRPGQKATSLRFCPFATKGNLKYADVALVIQFGPKFWPFRQERIFRFVTAQHKDGRLIWQQQPF